MLGDTGKTGEGLLLLLEAPVESFTTLFKLAEDERFLLMRLESSEEGDETDLLGLEGGGMPVEPVEGEPSEDGVVDLLTPLPMLNPPLLDGLLLLLEDVAGE